MIVTNKRNCSSPDNICNCSHPCLFFYSQIVALAALDDHIGWCGLDQICFISLPTHEFSNNGVWSVGSHAGWHPDVQCRCHWKIRPRAPNAATTFRQRWAVCWDVSRWTTIDLSKVFNAILAGEQTRLILHWLQWMYEILAHLKPPKRRYKEADCQHLLRLSIMITVLLILFIQQKMRL